MYECGRREDYTLYRVSFNALRYVPRLLQGFVGFPEPFVVEELYPFFQRFRLVNGLRRHIQEPYANYAERTLSEEPPPLLQLLLVIGKCVELNCISPYPEAARALPGAENLPDASGDLFNLSRSVSLLVGYSEKVPCRCCSTSVYVNPCSLRILILSSSSPVRGGRSDALMFSSVCCGVFAPGITVDTSLCSSANLREAWARVLVFDSRSLSCWAAPIKPER